MKLSHSIILLPLLLIACGKDAPLNQKTASGVTVNEAEKSVQVVTYMPVGEVKDVQHGKEVFLSYGAMSGVGEVIANGVGSIHVFEDKTSNVGIQLNIEGAPDGSFYEAWVAKPGLEPSKWISLGHIFSVVGDVRHALKSDQTADLSSYSLIKITKEKDDGNTAPGEVVSEGTLKKANR